MSKKIEELDEELEEEFEDEEEEKDSKSSKEEKKQVKFDELDVNVRFALLEIKKELLKEAERSEYFKEKIKDLTDEKLVDVWRYICEQVNKNRNQFTNGAVHSSYMIRCAIDYFNDNPEVKGTIRNGTLLTQTKDEEEYFNNLLTEEDREKAKNKAIADYEAKIKKDLENKQRKEEEKLNKQKEKEAARIQKQLEKEKGDQLSLDDFL